MRKSELEGCQQNAGGSFFYIKSFLPAILKQTKAIIAKVNITNIFFLTKYFRLAIIKATQNYTYMNIIIIVSAVMCVIMALCVRFDSKVWNDDGQYGLFVFRHKWVSYICTPMLFIVPLALLVYAAIMPLNVTPFVLMVCLRGLIFIGLLIGAAVLFILSEIVFFVSKK